MTNGEKIKEIFPTFEFIEETEKYRTPQHQFLKVHGINKMPYMEFDLGWWNAEYKEPTTRNCSGCKYAKDNHNASTEECHLCMWENQYTPTTKNDLALIHTEGLDEEIRCTMCTNSMKSDRGCDGSCVVDKDMYKAVMDAIEKRIQPTTKNDLGVDCISRTDVLKLIYDYKENHSENREEYPINYGTLLDMIRWVIALPSVTPQEPQTFKWCTDCKEYDQGKHCCHRWSNVIRDAVEEMRQEPFINKPCVSSGVCEHDKNEVLDKIRAEIVDLGQRTMNDNRASGIWACRDIIDKYKTEKRFPDTVAKIIKENKNE